jgi:hypothetical protein
MLGGGGVGMLGGWAGRCEVGGPGNVRWVGGGQGDVWWVDGWREVRSGRQGWGRGKRGWGSEVAFDNVMEGCGG